MKYQAEAAKFFAAVRLYRDGGENVAEYFATKAEAEAWIKQQKQPVGDEFRWMIANW